MGRRKTIDKEPVTVRFKELANGNKSIYLDIYINGKRQYEFLKLYLLPEVGRNKVATRQKNSETMEIANIIKAKRVIEIKEGIAGIKSCKSKMTLDAWIDVYKKYKLKNTQSPKNIEMHIYATKLQLEKYKGTEIKLCDIDKKYCAGFIDHLNSAKRKYTGTPLSNNTKKLYYAYFNDMLNRAVKEGLILKNPFLEIDSKDKPKYRDSERSYLELDEVKSLAQTECVNDDTKRAFMFSCFCGLRISDIRTLKWENIKTTLDDDGRETLHLSLMQQKTSRTVSYALPHEAVKWMPQKTDNPLVFPGLKSQHSINRHVAEWALKAGIQKHVTFHTARHTFGTMMITLGADLYTTSKLMGHSRTTTTEIYAKIVDKKKDEAMSLIDKFFDK